MRAVTTCLSHLLSVDVDAYARGSCVRRKPTLWVLVEEGPRRNDGEEGQRGAGEADVEGEFDVLRHEADEEGEYLAL